MVCFGHFARVVATIIMVGVFFCFYSQYINHRRPAMVGPLGQEPDHLGCLKLMSRCGISILLDSYFGGRGILTNLCDRVVETASFAQWILYLLKLIA